VVGVLYLGIACAVLAEEPGLPEPLKSYVRELHMSTRADDVLNRKIDKTTGMVLAPGVKTTCTDIFNFKRARAEALQAEAAAAVAAAVAAANAAEAVPAQAVLAHPEAEVPAAAAAAIPAAAPPAAAALAAATALAGKSGGCQQFCRL